MNITNGMEQGRLKLSLILVRQFETLVTISEYPMPH